MLKQSIEAIESIHECTTQYLDALEALPIKDWITTKNDKVAIRTKVHSHEKLAKDLEKVLTSCKHLLSGLESLIQVHKFPSIGSVVDVRP